ncbi:methyl-accepting chemotaxis protein [Clostridium algifaecis]|uniref:Methyl-accepting chemotaxis protein n=1 Tax=Clostridium algifaecis TaxID=1472040 RepID=A0ABS4KTI2_9CLOT|nr:methyl-accepting chemotaxis protein [Clostridium algifaecis]MBP2033359.1 methyl-accepting chemotaxis protein [Clostridium algifaecis]
MFKNAKIRVKFLIGFGIILIMMLITTVCAYYNFSHMETIQNKIINNVVPIDKINKEINNELIDEESGVRGYIASNGDAKYLETYSSSRKNLENEINEIQKYCAQYDSLTVIMKNEEIPNIEVINKHFDSQIQLVKTGKIEIARDRLGDGKGYMDVCKNIQGKLDNEINKITADSLNSSKLASIQSKLIMGIIFLISFLIATFIAVFFSSMMRTQLTRGIIALEEISNGNLSIEPLKVDSKDEFGQLGNAINSMQNSMKDIVISIINETENVNKALAISNKDIKELTVELEGISATVEQLSAGMEETAASTEEINSSSCEIESVVGTIADKAQDGAESAEEISKKALALKDDSVKLQEDANKTRLNIKIVMDAALEKTKKVEKIRALSETIFEISSQTNLLALNASIESVRAGEAGKGFSIVAEEIGKLAESSSEAVKQIQDTIDIVFEAVNNLSDASKCTLDYIETKVVKSYKDSVIVGESYNKDALYISNLVTDFSSTSQELLASMKTVSESINEISKANSEGSTGTNDIAEKILKIKDRADEVKDETVYVKESAEHLKTIVSKFSI